MSINLLMDKITLGKPIVGLTCDIEHHCPDKDYNYSKMPFYALRQNYCDAIAKAGGVPVILAYHTDLIEEYIQFLDGILLTGGPFDIDPQLFGDTTKHPSVKTKPQRTQFEYELVKAFFTKGKSILGICGGMQLLNVVFGGKLVQHIPDEIANALDHLPAEKPATVPAHSIQVVPQTLLDTILNNNDKIVHVNSSHHQCIKVLAERMKVSAVSPEDAVIEACEAVGHPFCLGVQWHPEYEINSLDTAIFKAFIKSMDH